MLDGLISFPFPLGPNRPCVRLILPANITRAEVRRISRMMETLCVDQSLDETLADMMRRQQEAMQNISPNFGSGLGGMLSGSRIGMSQPPPKPTTLLGRLKEWWNNRFVVSSA